MDEDARKIAALNDASLDAATRATLTETLRKSKEELAALQAKG